MLSFLNSAILFLAAAVTIPLLIHLFTRSKAKIVTFSTLEFLKELQQQKIRRIKLRHLILLILRMLIILLLILAFARPVVRQNANAAVRSNTKTTMAIILDNSYSMRCLQNGHSLFVRARELAKKIMQTFKTGDEAYLITSTDTTLLVSQRTFHDPTVLKREIDRIRIVYRPTNLSAAIEYATRVLQASPNINKEIYIISDFQKTGMRRDSVLTGDNIRIYALPIRSEVVSNLSIEGLKLVTTILEKGRTAELRARITNKGTEPARSRLAQLFLSGKRVAQTAISLEPGASKEETFRFILDNTGFVSGSVSLEADDISEDNQAYFTFLVPEKIKVALVGADEDVKYLLYALKPKAFSADNFDVKKIPAQALPFLQPDQYDVIVLSNVAKISSESTGKILDFVRAGGGLLMALGKNIDIKAYNEIINPRLHLPKFLSVMGSMQENAGIFSLGKTDFTHPIFAGIFEKKDAQFTRPNFSFAVKTARSANSQTIIEYSSGDPFLLETRLGQGSILVYTTGFDLSLSDFVHRTIFAPLITRSVSYLGAYRQSTQETFTIGDRLRYRLPAPAISQDLEMQRPDGQQDRLQPNMTASGAFVMYTGTDTPGLYKLTANGRVLYQWAVNVDVRESDLTIADEDELKKAYPIIFVRDADVLPNLVYRSRFGKELWSYLLIAAFVLLIMEMLVYREKGEVEA